MSEDFEQVTVEFEFDKPLYNILVQTSEKLGRPPIEIVKAGIVQKASEVKK